MATEPLRQVVLFTDVSGSTQLFQRLGDNEAHRVVELCVATARACTLEYAGRVIKGTGDGLLCLFKDVETAASAASEMQARLEIQRRTDAAIPPIRVGLAY